MAQTYESAEQFEDVFTKLVARIGAGDPAQLEALLKQPMLVRFTVREPEVDMWVDGRRSPITVSFGAGSDRPSLTAGLTGDSLHELLLGTLPLGKALSSRRLKVKGSLLKAKRLENLFHAFQSAYPALAAELLGDR
jgi:hypothetical protein